MYWIRRIVFWRKLLFHSLFISFFINMASVSILFEQTLYTHIHICVSICVLNNPTKVDTIEHNQLIYIYIYIYRHAYQTLALWFKCSPMARETWVLSQVESYQRLRKWYLMPPCLTLGNIRYGSRVKWVNHGKGVAPSSTPWCSSYRKGNLWVTLDYGHQLYLLIYRCIFD